MSLFRRELALPRQQPFRAGAAEHGLLWARAYAGAACPAGVLPTPLGEATRAGGPLHQLACSQAADGRLAVFARWPPGCVGPAPQALGVRCCRAPGSPDPEAWPYQGGATGCGLPSCPCPAAGWRPGRGGSGRGGAVPSLSGAAASPAWKGAAGRRAARILDPGAALSRCPAASPCAPASPRQGVLQTHSPECLSHMSCQTFGRSAVARGCSASAEIEPRARCRLALLRQSMVASLLGRA